MIPNLLRGARSHLVGSTLFLRHYVVCQGEIYVGLCIHWFCECALDAALLWRKRVPAPAAKRVCLHTDRNLLNVRMRVEK